MRLAENARPTDSNASIARLRPTRDACRKDSRKAVRSVVVVVLLPPPYLSSPTASRFLLPGCNTLAPSS